MKQLHLSRRWGAVLIGLIGVSIAFVPAPSSSAVSTDRYFRIEAGSFQYSPEAIHVNPGDRVTLELVPTDVVHGLYIDGYGFGMTADPGQSAQLTFVADRSGSFRFRCSVTCGALHPFMIGKLEVGSNELLARAIGLAMLAAVAGVWLARR